MTRLPRVALQFALVLVFAAGIVFWYYRFGMRKPGQVAVTYVGSHDFGSQMVNYIKQGRYDDAVRFARQSLQNRPSDTFIYQEIATTYLVRAQKDDLSQRDQWVANAVSYADKALSVYSKSEDNAGVQLFETARTFEIAKLHALLRSLVISPQLSAVPIMSAQQIFWRIEVRCCKVISLR